MVKKRISLYQYDKKLARQWHLQKNGDVTPKNVSYGSEKKVWWICKKGHEWQATVNHRTQGRGCPYCSNRKINKENCLAARNPDLAKQWHPIKNKDLTPYDVSPGSEKKVWWICSKNHEWQAIIYHRNRGIGCAVCSRRRASIETSIGTVNKELARQWHPTKNGELTPFDVTPCSDSII